MTLNGTSTSYNYNPANNELVSSTAPATSVNYGYASDGHLVSRNVTPGGSTSRWAYAWNVQGSLLSVSNGTSVQGYYAYNGLGRRVEAKEASSTLWYAYLGTETLLEHQSAGNDNDYLYAAGRRIARIPCGACLNPTPYYYHTDAVGSTRLVTYYTTKLNVAFSDNYQPYGQDNTVSGVETYRFTGKPVSQTTGLYYNYHRWYDPSIGRFLSVDPKHGRLSNPQTLNPYVYVRDIPTVLRDPSGEADCGWLSWGGCLQNAGEWVASEWNNDANFRTGVILTLATVAIVATAGAAAPVLVPTIAVGIGIGAVGSSSAYVIGSLATGRQITASGLFAVAATGAFLGAVGAVAGPVGGTLAKGIGFEATSTLARSFSSSLLAGAATAAGMVKGERDPLKLILSAGLAAGGASATTELFGAVDADTVGMTTLEQAAIFAPRASAFLEMSPNAAAVITEDIYGGTIGVGLDLLRNGI